MKLRRSVLLAVVISFVCTVATVAPASSAALTAAEKCSDEFYNGDRRLGPAVLPTRGPVAQQLVTYQRFAGLTPEEYLARYWDATANGGRGGWRFPPSQGYIVGPTGEPIKAPHWLPVGQALDRYGSEFGAFLGAKGELYSQRAIPPESLANFDPSYTCNYHAYAVVRSFTVAVGPIAPALGQPGKGVQFVLDASLVPSAPTPLNVKWLVDNGFLRRTN